MTITLEQVRKLHDDDLYGNMKTLVCSFILFFHMMSK